VKREATLGNSRSQSRRYQYTKVLDNRKHAIRGLWRRGGKFLARITVEDEQELIKTRWTDVHSTHDGSASMDTWLKIQCARIVPAAVPRN
jgi:hypothetical protein